MFVLHIRPETELEVLGAVRTRNTSAVTLLFPPVLTLLFAAPLFDTNSPLTKPVFR